MVLAVFVRECGLRCLHIQEEVRECLDIFQRFVAEVNRQLATKKLDTCVGFKNLIMLK